MICWKVSPLITESYKLQPYSAKANRYFIHLDEIGRPLVKKELGILKDELKIPEEAHIWIEEKITDSDITFIGVDEENGICVYKIYIGFASLMGPNADGQAFSVEWTAGETIFSIKEYTYEKEVSETNALVLAKECLASSAFEADPGGEKLYQLCAEIISQTLFTSNFLSVKQQDTARRSVYFSLVENEPLFFKNLRVEINLIAALLDVPTGQLQWLNQLCLNEAILEHISIGINNQLQPFITFYRNPEEKAPEFCTGIKTTQCNLIQSKGHTNQTLNTLLMENPTLQSNEAEVLPSFNTNNESLNLQASTIPEVPVISPLLFLQPR